MINAMNALTDSSLKTTNVSRTAEMDSSASEKSATPAKETARNVWKKTSTTVLTAPTPYSSSMEDVLKTALKEPSKRSLISSEESPLTVKLATL
jgi:hypothetical protein